MSYMIVVYLLGGLEFEDVRDLEMYIYKNDILAILTDSITVSELEDVLCYIKKQQTNISELDRFVSVVCGPKRIIFGKNDNLKISNGLSKLLPIGAALEFETKVNRIIGMLRCIFKQATEGYVMFI